MDPIALVSLLDRYIDYTVRYVGLDYESGSRFLEATLYEVVVSEWKPDPEVTITIVDYDGTRKEISRKVRHLKVISTRSGLQHPSKHGELAFVFEEDGGDKSFLTIIK